MYRDPTCSNTVLCRKRYKITVYGYLYPLWCRPEVDQCLHFSTYIKNSNIQYCIGNCDTAPLSFFCRQL